MAISRVLFPESLEQAVGWLADPTLKAQPLAGGTALAVSRSGGADTLVDVTRLGLDRIQALDGDIAIGAGASIQQVADAHALDGVAGGMLRSAAARVASRLVRNGVTVGGNAVQVYPWSDLPVALSVLDGVAELVSVRGRREVALEDFFAQHPRRVLEAGELLVRLRVRVTGPELGGAYLKFGRTEVDDALVSVASTLSVDATGTIVRARIAVGAVKAVPVRCPEAEAALVGGPASEARCADAARIAREHVVPLEDARASREYRSHLVEVMVRRALVESLAQITAAAPAEAAPAVPGATPPIAAGARPVGEPPAATTAGGRMEIHLLVNGAPRTFRIGASDLLADVLRREGYESVKKGCGEGTCGACTVLVDGVPRLSCILFAAQVHGRHVTSVEALGTPLHPHSIQKAFVKAGAVQCGFCTPGMLLSTKALLERHPEPTEAHIKEALDGHLCRCTGYVKQIEAVQLAARAMKEGAE